MVVSQPSLKSLMQARESHCLLDLVFGSLPLLFDQTNLGVNGVARTCKTNGQASQYSWAILGVLEDSKACIRKKHIFHRADDIDHNRTSHY